MTRYKKGVSVLILAAGKGSRFGRPKGQIEVDGKTFVKKCVDTLGPLADQILVGVPANELNKTRMLFRGTPVVVLVGGKSRHQTFQILLRKAEYSVVLLHDVARPFVTRQLARRVLQKAERKGAVASYIRLHTVDTVAVMKDQKMSEVLGKEDLVQIQTPQAFSADLLSKCCKKLPKGRAALHSVASFVHQQGHPLFLVEGDETNLKITYPEDLPKKHKKKSGRSR